MLSDPHEGVNFIGQIPQKFDLKPIGELDGENGPAEQAQKPYEIEDQYKQAELEGRKLMLQLQDKCNEMQPPESENPRNE